MKYAGTLILVLAACHVDGSLRFLEDHCSSNLRLHSKLHLIGGVDAKLFSTPWMAYLHRNGNFICGGSLITYRFVLTAAHCRKLDEQIVVRLGEYDVDTQIDCRDRGCALPFEDHEVESFYSHPSYTTIKHFDIALVKLKTRVVEQNNITPICLLLDTTDTWQRYVDSIQQFSVAGWGWTEAGSFSHVLKTANVTQVDQFTCLADFGFEVDQSHICAGDPARHTCYGDSGGPLFATISQDLVDYNVQFGIVSYGENPCQGVGVFTNVKSYIPWIEHTINRANTVA
ncbi:serine protease grass-like isoform X2 [Drosophila pseudoobscura]|uniref:Serine protease grass-like isoform X2 n=1 Tax=Drosophila pseudoobscura pseudoobscura TaxID=46245 RepID=A0A6I8VTL5_DROPS|nr:serine protease grass isoform X2 [Drosophila pseudoobscura]